MSFNFNKLRAMIGARAVLGIELDTDQIVFAGIDQMFNSTAREVTERHPWPIMPVHWMSRDDHEGNPYRVYAFRGYNGTHTMRWGHAHPTWSFWALPFLLDTLLERLLASEGPNKSFMAWRLPEARERGLSALLEQGSLAKAVRQVVPAMWMQEDEDMLNVASWRDGVEKQWCKFDLEPGLYTMRYGLEQDIYMDPYWYPNGVPVLFLSSHNTKKFAETDWLLALLTLCRSRPASQCPSPKRQFLDDVPPRCRFGTPAERALRARPADYAAQVCCCLQPRWSSPFYWH